MIRVFVNESAPISCLTASETTLFYSVKESIKGINEKTLAVTHKFNEHKDNILCLFLSHHNEDSILISGSKDKTIKVWNLRSSKCTHTFYGHRDAVVSIIKHENKIISASRDGTIKIWNYSTLECTLTIFIESSPRSIVYHEESNTIFANTLDGAVYSIKIKGITYEKEDLFSSSVQCIALGKEILYTGWEDNTIRLFNVETHYSTIVLFGHNNVPTSLSYFNGVLFSASSEEMIVWNTFDGKLKETFQGPDISTKYCVLNSRNVGALLLTISTNSRSIFERSISDIIRSIAIQNAFVSISEKDNNYSIDLENLGLESLPEIDHPNSSKVKSFNISNNRIKRLPASISLLSNLEEFNCSINSIKLIPSELQNLSKIRILQLNNNNLSEIPEWIGHLTNLTELYLGQNQITRLCSGISELTNLEKLDLGENYIDYVSESLLSLTKLNYLDLKKNRFTFQNKDSKTRHRKSETRMPIRNSSNDSEKSPQITKTSRRRSSKRAEKSVGYSSSDGKSSDEVEQLKKPRRFSYRPIKKNYFKEKSEGSEVLDIVSITRFNFSALLNLVRINLSYNSLLSIPPSLMEAKNLQKLNLSYNSISQISEDIKNLVHLEVLDISHNLITELPQNFSLLRNLKELYADHNRLSELLSFGSMLGLEKLDLSHNNLKGLPHDFERLLNLTYLNLSYNQFKVFPYQITCLPIQKLFISNNLIESIPFEIICMTNLHTLDASKNRVSHVCYKGLSNVKVLDLRNNKLKSIPPDIKYLRNVEILRISKNNIESLASEIDELKKLNTLYAKKNFLSSLPNTISYLPKLSRLNLKGNNAIFDYSNYIFPRDFQSVSTKVYNESIGSVKWSHRGQLCFCGPSGSGKTTLYQILRFGKSKKKIEPTKGIKYDEWQIKLNVFHEGKTKSYKFNYIVKDFSGHINMKVVNRFYINENSIYIVTWNLSQPNGFLETKYWISMIKTYAPDSPIIVVCTYKDNYDSDLVKNMKNQIMKDNNNVIDLIPFNLLTNDTEYLHKLIEKLVLSVSLPGYLIPLNIYKLSSVIPKIRSQFMLPFVELPDFYKAISKYSIPDELLGSTIRYLHSLGFILDLDRFTNGNCKAVILDPQWLSEIIFDLFTYNLVQNGYFLHDNIEKVWETIKAPYHYSYISMIHKLEIACDDGSDMKSSRNFYSNISILPSLLPEIENEVSVWKKSKETEIVKIYKVGFVPTDFLPVFISRCSKIAKHHDLWRLGCVFILNNSDGLYNEENISMAKIEAKNENTIKVTTRGSNLYSFTQTISSIINDIIVTWNVSELKFSSYAVCYEENKPIIFPLSKIESVIRNGENVIKYNDNFSITTQKLFKETNVNII